MVDDLEQARGVPEGSLVRSAKVALFDKRKVERLLQNPAIVRNRAKVESTVANAKAVRRVQDEEGSLDALLWSFVDGHPKVNRFRKLGEIPAETAKSAAMSKELKRRIPVRGADGLLRVHAGLRPRQRPRRTNSGGAKSRTDRGRSSSCVAWHPPIAASRDTRSKSGNWGSVRVDRFGVGRQVIRGRRLLTAGSREGHEHDVR